MFNVYIIVFGYFKIHDINSLIMHIIFISLVISYNHYFLIFICDCLSFFMTQYCSELRTSSCITQYQLFFQSVFFLHDCISTTE